MIRKLLTSLAATAALVATPVMAQASGAERAPAPVEGDAEHMAGNGGAIIIAILAAAAIIAGIVVAVDDEDVDLPTSP